MAQRKKKEKMADLGRSHRGGVNNGQSKAMVNSKAVVNPSTNNQKNIIKVPPPADDQP